MPPKAVPKQLLVKTFFKTLRTDEERATQQARKVAEAQHFAEHVQQQQKWQREAEEMAMDKCRPGRPPKLSKLSGKQ